MTTDELAELMQERPDGIESSTDYETLEGFSVTDPDHPERSGMVAHRGVLAPGEYVDEEALSAAVEEHFGYTHSEVSAIYKQGEKTPTQREFRAYIDARMLALSRAGANMAVLAKLLGLGEKTIDRALARARQAYIEPQGGFTPVVIRPCMCFICTAMTAKPRRRRFSESPPHLVGTINLCQEDYAKGFTEEPGNPAYWAFRKRTR